MVRFNILLLLAAVLCALSVVTSQHQARKLFQAMETEQERARQLDVEYDQLQIELSTWATSPRIDKIAREKLKMRPVGNAVQALPAGSTLGVRAPEAAKIVTASSASQGGAR
jgi:cell division protein FtsL